MARLGDLFLHIRNGANIKQGLDNTGYPITRIETISNRTVDRNKMGYAGITDLEKYSDFVMQDGDILMSHINSDTHLGKTALYEKEGDEIIIHGMNLLSLRPNKDLIASKYAFYYLSSQSFLRQIPNITKKSVNQASFTVSALKELVFPITSIEEQKKITLDLDKVNDLISLRKQQLSKLDELVKSRFIELFGDPETNPKGLEKVLLSDIAEYFNGLTYSPDNVTNDGTVVLRSSNIQNSQLDFADTVRVSGSIKEKLFVKDNDILMCSRNGSARLVGKVALIKNLSEPMTFGAFMMIIRSKYYSYLMTYFQMDAFRRQISTGATTTINQITGNMLNKISLPLPKMADINEFAAFVEQTDKSKLEIQKSLEKLETLKKALMQKYFG